MLATTYLLLALSFSFQESSTLPTAQPPSGDALSHAHEASEDANGRKPPVLVYSVDPEFTEAARKKRFSGSVKIQFVVDENGKPQDVRVVHGVGLGLDEKAVEAVKQYRFKPATVNGKPVAMPWSTAVNFQIF